jgi:outer membrane receptor protein involved in Fe transport
MATRSLSRLVHATIAAIPAGFALILPGPAGAVEVPDARHAEKTFPVDIPAGLSLRDALRKLADHIPDLRRFDDADEALARTPVNAVHGHYTLAKALELLLSGTDVAYELTGNFVHVKPTERPLPELRPFAAESSEDTSKMPEVMVEGDMSLNNLRARTALDPVPYLVFNSEQLSTSSFATLGEFLQANLSSHVRSAVTTAAGAIAGDATQINLLGLGGGQTVVTIDGQQRAQINAAGVVLQPNLDSISLWDIQRLEVVTGAASAEAGPGALGGYVNLVHVREAGTKLILEADHYAGMRPGAARLGGEHVIPLSRTDWVSFSFALNWRDQILLRDDNSLTSGRQRAAANDPSLLAVPPLGAETNVAAADGTPLLPGGRFPYLSVPANWDGDLSKLRSRDGVYNYDLAPTSQERGGGAATLQPGKKSGRANAAGKLHIFDNLLSDFDVGFSKESRWGEVSFVDQALNRTFFLPADSPGNVFHKGVFITRPLPYGDGIMVSNEQSWYASGGLSYVFSDGSRIRFSQGFSGARAQTTQPELRLTDDVPNAGGGVLEMPAFSYSLDNITVAAASSEMEDTTVMFSRPVHRSSRDNQSSSTFTLTAQRRHQSTQIPDSLFGATATGDTVSRRSQDMYSLQAALDRPVYLSQASQPDFQIGFSARGDSYSISLPDSANRNANFHALNETLSLGWHPAGWLLLRGGYSTGFVPPPLALLTNPVEQMLPQLPVPDPQRNGELIGPVTVSTGGDEHLRPEKARTYRAGFVIQALDDSLLFAIDFTRVMKDDAIVGSERFFDDPEGYIARDEGIEREVTTDGSVGRIVRIRAPAINVAKQDVRALGFSSSWTWNMQERGDLHFNANGTYVTAFERRTSPDSPEIDDAGVVTQGPPRFRLITSMVYHLSSYRFGFTSRFTSANRVSRDEGVITTQGGEKIRSQVYHDLFFSYSPDARMTVRFDARNVLQSRPPFDATEAYYRNRDGVDERSLYRLSIGFNF